MAATRLLPPRPHDQLAAGHEAEAEPARAEHIKRIALCTVNPLLILTLFSRLSVRGQTTAIRAR